jgi:hypothetical protein
MFRKFTVHTTLGIQPRRPTSASCHVDFGAESTAEAMQCRESDYKYWMWRCVAGHSGRAI